MLTWSHSMVMVTPPTAADHLPPIIIAGACPAIRVIPDAPERYGWMRPYTKKEKAKIRLGALASLVVVAWIAVLSLAILSVR